jgi:GMP synthase-like glutamine amidotransferase
MRVLAIQNHPGAPLGRVGKVLDARGVDIDAVLPTEGDALPTDDRGYDGVIILGGPMSAVADETYPHLAQTVDLINQFSAADKGVLGICLGAQLVARANGAKPRLNVGFEFGYTEITPTPAAADDPIACNLTGSPVLMEWHRDSFEPLPGAVHLASSSAFPMQGFRLGRATYGFQFHFEATPEIIEGWLGRAIDEIRSSCPNYRDRVGSPDDPRHDQADLIGRRLTDAWIDLL